jgi:hypothetical protein
MALSSLNLADLNGDNGFIINGAEEFDYSSFLAVEVALMPTSI